MVQAWQLLLGNYYVHPCIHSNVLYPLNGNVWAMLGATIIAVTVTLVVIGLNEQVSFK